MIDIHTHILPGLDDGAKTEEEAKRLLRLEVSQGVSELVFTPHYYGKKRSLEQFMEERAEAMQKIASAVPEGLKTRLGAEVRMTGVNDPSDDALCALAIEGTKYVLVEFPFFAKWPKSLFNKLNMFMSDTGYTPIVAHIERYETALKEPVVVCKLADMGCLIQMNTHAFLDKKTKRFAYALLKHGLVHCLATDTHDDEGRLPDYAAAKTAVCAAGYEKEWKRVQRCMRTLLDSRSVSVAYTPVKRFLGWYF